MFHIGIGKLKYLVKFHSSCYYPFSFSEERTHTKILFGASFGWWWENSISISQRPSHTKIDKIDLFTCTYKNGIKFEDFIGSVNIEENYLIKLIFDKHNLIYRVQVFPHQQAHSIINSCIPYKYPAMDFGWTINRNQGKKIVLEKQ